MIKGDRFMIGSAAGLLLQGAMPMKHRALIGAWFPAAIITVVALLISTGCVTVIAEPRAFGVAPAEAVPLDVGLYLSDAFKGYRGAGSKWDGTQIRYPNLGEASAVQFQRNLDRTFRTITIVNERPPFTASRDSTLHAIIEPAIEYSEFEYPATAVGTYGATIYYKIIVYDMAGRVMVSRASRGHGQAKIDFGSNLTNTLMPGGMWVPRGLNPYAAAVSTAIEAAASNALKALLDSEEFKVLWMPAATKP